MDEARAAAHYDRVTEVWRRYIMGEDLHFGYFETPKTNLHTATAALTEQLADRAQLEAGHRVLDLGCGVGGPAQALAARGCEVLGISTSAVGVETATARAAAAGLGDRVRFEVADATAHVLPDASFDRVWSLESAHLMDFEPLFAQCARVLRPGGRLALCDVLLVDDMEGYRVEMGYQALGHSGGAARRMRAAVDETLHRAFGSSALRHVGRYAEAIEAAGFVDVEVEDISAPTKRTLRAWADNAHAHYDAIEAELGRAYLDDFFVALLHMSFGWGRNGGYAIITARKPG